MLSTIFINYYDDLKNQQNKITRSILLFHVNVFEHMPALNTLIFSK